MEAISSEIGGSYLVSGKTMNQWRSYFNIKLPDVLTPEELGKANAKLSNAINEASFHYAHAIIVEQSIRTGATDKFDDAFRSLVENYRQQNKKLPAEATLRTMAETGDMGIKSAIPTASANTKFWKTVNEGLQDQRRVFEQQRWIMFTEMKIAQEY